ncbi:MAG: lipoprotein-releasing ABC transporter permease subunit [Gammaproteobacteria bacterium]|nr:lipoprotein-releasing ABC transporter permease subunit [Gammaproteobacteria bacterium]
MFQPLEIFIGLRYLQTRQQNRFVSFITLASLIGVALGVAALIVVLSVMNGFENELRGRLLSMTSHATVAAVRGGMDDWREIIARAHQQENVVGAAPYVQLQGMLANGANLNGALVRGIDPQLEKTVDQVGSFMVEGTLDSLDTPANNIVLGRLLALRLGIDTGDRVTLLVPQTGLSAGDIRPRVSRFTVSGIFEAGLQEHDGSLALVNIYEAATLAGLGDSVSGVRLQFDDVFAAPGGIKTLAANLDSERYRYSDWTVENASYFRAIRIEKTMMSIILLLVVAVAVFNIVATLMMVVTDKRSEIAILRTLGLKPKSVVRIFMIQGVVIGWVGALTGVGLGILLALNVGTIMPKLEALFGFQVLPADVYYISQLPSDLHTADVLFIAAAAFVLSVIATIFPARRAAKVEPAEALRYD